MGRSPASVEQQHADLTTVECLVQHREALVEPEHVGSLRHERRDHWFLVRLAAQGWTSEFDGVFSPGTVMEYVAHWQGAKHEDRSFFASAISGRLFGSPV